MPVRRRRLTGKPTSPPSTLDQLVRATPASRDRVVDFARALSIVVVVLWHWVLSVTFRTPGGSLVMANPLHVVPGGWLLTWVGQVMPVFFLAGGYVNLLGWQRAQVTGQSAGAFVGGRLRRLLKPTAVWALVWIGAEMVAAAQPGGHRWVWEWFPGYLAPLWFLAVYALLIVAVPITATWHLRSGGAALGTLILLIIATGVLGRVAGIGWATWVTVGLVWIFCHQLGYAWRTWDLGHRTLAPRLALAGAGLIGLIGLTTIGDHPPSMVATVTSTESNIWPTNAAIAALATFQLGLLAGATPTLERALHRAWVWKPVVVVNAWAMTIFVWHMTAYVVVAWAYERLGGVLLDQPTAQWLSQRWLWLLTPLAVLTLLVGVFGRYEVNARSRDRSPR